MQARLPLKQHLEQPPMVRCRGWSHRLGSSLCSWRGSSRWRCLSCWRARVLAGRCACGHRRRPISEIQPAPAAAGRHGWDRAASCRGCAWRHGGGCRGCRGIGRALHQAQSHRCRGFAKHCGALTCHWAGALQQDHRHCEARPGNCASTKRGARSGCHVASITCTAARLTQITR